MTLNFLPAALAVFLLTSAFAGKAQAQGYAGLIAGDDAPAAATEKTTTDKQGGYGGLIAPIAPLDNGGNQATGYQGLMPAAPATSQEKIITRQENKKNKPDKTEQAVIPGQAPAEDPATAMARLQKAANQEGHRRFKKDSVERMKKMFPLSDEAVEMLREKYDNPQLENGMTENESIIAKNVDFYLAQVNQPGLSAEKRSALARDAYEQLGILEIAMTRRGQTPVKAFQQFIDKGVSTSGIQAYIQGEKNAAAKLSGARKALEPLQAAVK